MRMLVKCGHPTDRDICGPYVFDCDIEATGVPQFIDGSGDIVVWIDRESLYLNGKCVFVQEISDGSDEEAKPPAKRRATLRGVREDAQPSLEVKREDERM